MHQLDVETAFLNGKLDEEIYVEQPPGHIAPGFENHVLKLDKALYGLKQASNVWATAFKNAMLKLDYTQSTADDSIFTLSSTPSSGRTIVAIYVDDILVLAKHNSAIDTLVAQLGQTFRIRPMGPVKRFLSMDIIRPNSFTIHVSHQNYVQRILTKFNMQNCNPAKTPCDSQSIPPKTVDGDEPTDAEEYRSITGSIMHLAVYTRPDIMFATSKLAQFNDNPSVQHYHAAKHLLRYIQGTKHFVLTYTTTLNPFAPIGFCDASYAADPDDRKSTSGYIFFLANGPISWQSVKQSTVALSTMEAEYIALSEAAKEAKFLRHLLSTIFTPIFTPTVIKTDSQAALKHVKNNIRHARTKHIDTRHHFIRSVYANHEIDIEHVSSTTQAADILTKPLARVKHEESLLLFNLHLISTSF
jgi:hypothetical protein